MKIGILGTRGIPNAYGGFEQFAQYLALGLQQKGYDISVYNSSNHPYRQSEWNGVHIIHCKDPEKRLGAAGQFIYDYNCLKDARKRNFDILLQLGYTSNSVWHRIWPGSTIHIINMDGLEWKRSKYSKPVRRFLLKAEKWAVRHADVLIADSTGIRNYIQEKYKRTSVYIPYGAEIPGQYDPAVPEQFGLEAGNYFLLIARMEPENNIEMVIRGYLSSRRIHPLVIIGNPGNGFGQYLVKQYPDKDIRFLGAIYDQEKVNALRHYSTLYLHGHSVGGTNPSLLEAMACQCTIAAHDNAFNRAILQDDAFYFSSPKEVSNSMDQELHPDTRAARKEANAEKIRSLYSWDKIIYEYEQVMLNSAIKK